MAGAAAFLVVFAGIYTVRRRQKAVNGSKGVYGYDWGGEKKNESSSCDGAGADEEKSVSNGSTIASVPEDPLQNVEKKSTTDSAKETAATSPFLAPTSSFGWRE
jgi:hypothetical protein